MTIMTTWGLGTVMTKDKCAQRPMTLPVVWSSLQNEPEIEIHEEGQAQLWISRGTAA